MKPTPGEPRLIPYDPSPVAWLIERLFFWVLAGVTIFVFFYFDVRDYYKLKFPWLRDKWR